MDEVKELPLELVINMKKTQINVSLDYVEQAGLLMEFINFTLSPQAFGLECWEDFFIEFAKQHPDKFQVTPETERVEYCVYMEKGKRYETKIAPLPPQLERHFMCKLLHERVVRRQEDGTFKAVCNKCDDDAKPRRVGKKRKRLDG